MDVMKVLHVIVGIGSEVELVKREVIELPEGTSIEDHVKERLEGCCDNEYEVLDDSVVIGEDMDMEGWFVID